MHYRASDGIHTKCACSYRLSQFVVDIQPRELARFLKRLSADEVLKESSQSLGSRNVSDV